MYSESTDTVIWARIIYFMAQLAETDKASYICQGQQRHFLGAGEASCFCTVHVSTFKSLQLLKFRQQPSEMHAQILLPTSTVETYFCCSNQSCPICTTERNCNSQTFRHLINNQCGQKQEHRPRQNPFRRQCTRKSMPKEQCNGEEPLTSPPEAPAHTGSCSLLREPVKREMLRTEREQLAVEMGEGQLHQGTPC